MLLARPLPFIDESPEGIFMRAAYLNGWPDVQKMVYGHSNTIIVNSSIFRDRPRFQSVVCRLGISLPEGMLPAQLRRTQSGIYVSYNASLEFPREIFRGEGGAVCPDCLAERKYHKSSWTLRLMSTCEVHGCMLLTTCPVCSMELGWNRPGPHLCRCGFDLRNAERVPGNIDLSRELLNRIDGRDQASLLAMSARFLALKEFFSFNAEPFTEEDINHLAAKDRQEVIEYLASYVVSRVEMVHPRVVLLPLLKRSNMRELAIDVLRKIADVVIPAMPEDTLEGSLNGDECAAALGVSKAVFVLGLYKEKLLEIRKSIGREIENRYTKESVDLLLRTLWTQSSAANQLIRQRPLTEPLTQLASDMWMEPEANGGYDLDKGLFGLRRLTNKTPTGGDLQSQKLINISEAAIRLDVHSRVIFSMLDRGHLTRVKVPHTGRRIFISRDEIERFNQDFICVGALSRILGQSKTQFIRTLRSHGVQPVAGPGIDGLIVYLVARKDLAHLDSFRLRNEKAATLVSDQIVAEREPDQPFVGEYLTIAEAATELNISALLIAKLVRENKLERVTVPISAVAISKASVDELKFNLRDKSLKDVKVVLAEIRENYAEFSSRWVSTGIVTVIDLGVRECIKSCDFKKLLSLKDRYMTAKEAATLFDRGKHFLPNLELRGAIHSIRMGTVKTLKLFAKADILRIQQDKILAA